MTPSTEKSMKGLSINFLAKFCFIFLETELIANNEHIDMKAFKCLGITPDPDPVVSLVRRWSLTATPPLRR